MPCYDSRNNPDYIRKDFRHNSDVAEMLCSILKDNPNIKKNKSIEKWWKEHQKRDARILKENGE